MGSGAPAWMVLLWIILVVVIVYLLYRLFTVSHSLDDSIIILIKQLCSLREGALFDMLNYAGKPVAWSSDALAIPGPKGEILIRRFALQQEWLQGYEGVQGEKQKRVRARIDELDKRLLRYRLNLAQITALTERMMQEIYQGDVNSSSLMAENIIRKLRTI